MVKYIYIIIGILLSTILSAQDGVVVGTKPGNISHVSAELEVYSTSKGVLIPTITVPTTAITSPATGLLVYNTTSNRLNYYDGTGWIELPYFTTVIDNDNDTRVTVERGDNDNDSIYFFNKTYMTASLTAAGFDMFSKNAALWSNTNDKIFATPSQNTNLGLGAGIAITTGNSNTCVGSNAGKIQTTASYNTYLGASAASSATGSNNTFIGASSGVAATGNRNTLIGTKSGFSISSGAGNVAIGSQSGYANTTGSNNVIVGKNAGYNMFPATGSNNILIGNNTTFTSDVSNSMQIGQLISANSTGNIIFNDKYMFPNVSSVDGYTLMLNADKKTLRWADAGISPVDQTVVASAANLYTFDIGMRTGQSSTVQRQVFFVPIIPNVNTSISSIMVWVKVCLAGNLQVAIYDGTDNRRLAYSVNNAFSLTGPGYLFANLTLSAPGVPITKVDLVKGHTYWIGIRTDGACNFDYAVNKNTLGTIRYLSYYSGTVAPQCAYASSATESTDKPGSMFENIPDLDAIPVLPYTKGAEVDGFNQCEILNTQLPWVRAY